MAGYFGPRVNQEAGKSFNDKGRIAGDEILAYEDEGEGKQNVAMLLQVPGDFSKQRRCLVAIPVAGSASWFRDIVDFGYWGLRHRCAVVYTDKGHGNGFHLLENDTVNLLDGPQVPSKAGKIKAHFRADLDHSARNFPCRMAASRCIQGRTFEAKSGEGLGSDLLRSVQFAFVELAKRDPGFTRDKTIVIATGSSNGGGAVLYGAEKNAAHLLDGVVAREPQVQFKPDDRVAKSAGTLERRGTGRSCSIISRSGISISPVQCWRWRTFRCGTACHSPRTDASPFTTRAC